MQLKTDLLSDLFYGTAGPRNAKILVVGEAWGEQESYIKEPLVGQSGREFFRILRDAGLISKQDHAIADRAAGASSFAQARRICLSNASILLTNVVSDRPDANDFTKFLHPNPTKKVDKDALALRGLYPNALCRKHLDRLLALIDAVKPTLIIAAGNWPLWALTDHASTDTKKGFKLPGGIVTWRGSQTYSREIAGNFYPVLPIIHPAAILREWGYRSITVHDLRSRAGRFLNGSLSWTPPTLNSVVRPSFDEVLAVLNAWIARAHREPFYLSCDLETYQRKYISVCGLADEHLELCIPFFYFDSAGAYHAIYTLEEELQIWDRLKSLIHNPNALLIGQNFIYDTQWFFRYYGIEALVDFETMVAQHLLFPGVPKSLAYLASLYCNHYCYWKDESEDWNANELGAEQLWVYSCKDLRATYEAAMLLRRLIAARKKEDQYEFLLSSWRVARKSTLRGILYDLKKRDSYVAELSHQLSIREQWLEQCMPPQFRKLASGKPYFTSAHFLRGLLYEKLGLAEQLHKTTKKPTTDDSALSELAERYPEFARWLDTISEWRSMNKFMDFLKAKEGVTNRLHPQFNVAQPETFRWSSSENAFSEATNCQNVPKVED